MKPGIFPFLLIAYPFWIAVSVHASAQTVRVAVAGNSSLVDLVDVTTAELSKQPELNVLDRADLDKLGKEQAIQAVLAAKDFSPVRLLPADGLVLLRAVAKDGKTGVFARLVAVQPGVILREVALPDNADPLTQAQALAKEFAPYWSKLAAIQKGKITALSLLGLRFEVDAPETREMERSINILLASRLSAEPDTLVLERWRLNDALFEKTLAPQQPSPFWTGSSLIDGSLQLKDNRVSVTLRLRPPQGSEISISDNDTADNLPALAGRLADKIQNRPISQNAWNPSAEASHYSELGKWCLDNGLPDEGAEAIESALALGDNTRTTHMLQVEAYAMQAYPENLSLLFPRGDNYRPDAVAPDSLPQRVEAARLATTLLNEYLKSNRNYSTSAWNAEDPADLGLPVLYNCLRLLRAVYENSFQVDHADDIAGLRHEIQKVIAGLDDRLLVQPDTRISTDPKSLRKRAYLHHRVYYAGLWHDRPEETTAFYRENLGPKLDGLGIHDALFEFDIIHAPYIDGDGKIYNLGPAYSGPPWIVAWDGRSPDQVKAVWQNFLNDLAGSSDPVLQCDALKFEFHSSHTVEGRNAVLARFIAFLQQHADSISQPRGPAFASGFDPLLYWATQQNADSCRDIANIYIAMFQKHRVLPPSWINDMSRLQFYRGSAEVTPDLLSALNDYNQWYQSQKPQDRRLVRALAEAQQTIYRAKPGLKPELLPATAQTDFLPVTRFWLNSVKASDGSIYPTAPYVFVDQATLTISENKIWFINHHKPYQVSCVDPATMQLVSTLPIPDAVNLPGSGINRDIHALDVTSQWLAVGVEDRAYLYSRADNQWKALDVPPFIYKPRFVNQQLYLLYGPVPIPGTYDTKNEGSGLIRVSLPGGEIENVISSRRIPPQNALDGKPLGYPLDLWLSQAGLTLAVNANHPPFQAYATPLGKNDWSRLTSAPERCQVRLNSGGALIIEGKSVAGFGQLTFVDPSGSKLLLANPDIADKDSTGQPAWNIPKEMRTKSPAVFEQISPIMRGNDLCLYYNLQNGVADGKEASLYYFAKGQKDGVRIPLAFDIDAMKKSRPQWVRYPTPVLNFGSLQATDNGLVIYGLGDPGFWVIPWSDIDAYRAKAHPTASASALAKPAQ